MRGFMTPLNRVLAAHPHTVGLSQRSELREVLSAFIPMLHLAHSLPSHITELVAAPLPHYYGYVDACARGGGGVWLPCTRPLLHNGSPASFVWRVQWPDDIWREVSKDNGTINNNDIEAAVVFLGECILDDLLRGDTAGINSHLGSDNSATVAWNQRVASRATHRQPERLLRWKALRQRWTRRGPQDVTHYAGFSNEMADLISRSYDDFCQAGPTQDNTFLHFFSQRFPLTSHPQLGSWQLAQPRPETVSAVLSLLRGQTATTTPAATSTGDGGVVDLPRTSRPSPRRSGPTPT
jgi:hypothetical protein